MPRQDPNTLPDQLPTELSDQELETVAGGADVRQPRLPQVQRSWGLEDWIEAGCPND